MRNRTNITFEGLGVLLLMLLIPFELVAQHAVIRLEGYLMELISEGQPRNNLGNAYIKRDEDKHRFFLTSMDIPWESMAAFSCFYKLNLIEINDVDLINRYNNEPVYRLGTGHYHLDTIGITSLQKPLQSDKVSIPTLRNLDNREYLDKSSHARVDFFRCSIWVIYLEDYGYGDCDGNLRKIPQYGIIKHSDNHWYYLCSMVMPVFLKLPKPYRAYEH